MSRRTSRTTALTLVAFATFADLVAYSIAVPVLPDLSRRLGATPSVVGLLFASFGLTLLVASIPMGALSDRIGRKGPLVGGMLLLAAGSALFAWSDSLPWLFAARLVQGTGDAITWVVGFALIADLYGPDERGAAMGIVMGSTSVALMVGPTLGGWLYEMGGVRLPFLFVAGAALAGAAGLAWFEPPREHAAVKRSPIARIVQDRGVFWCTVAVVVLSASLSMLEPVWPLFLNATLATSPGVVGLLFGIGAIATATLNPIYGRLADRWGGRRLMVAGLVATAVLMPVMSRIGSFPQAVAIHVAVVVAMAMVITPSLAYMGDAVAATGEGTFGVAYGLYNLAWGVGLLGGPAAGGFLFERIGFGRLTLAWALAVAVVAVPLAASRGRPARV